MADDVKTLPSNARQLGYEYVEVPGAPGTYAQVETSAIDARSSAPVPNKPGKLFKSVRKNQQTAKVAVPAAAFAGGIPAPVNTVAPSYTGIAKVGQVLVAQNGTWGNGPTRYDYQWTKDGDDIPGATGATYLVKQADLGSIPNVRVTAVNFGGSTSASSTSNEVVVAANTVSPLSLSASQVVGTVGETLTITPTAAGGVTPYTFAYYIDPGSEQAQVDPTPPTGLTINPSTGVTTYTEAVASTYPIGLKVTDAAGTVATTILSFVFAPVIVNVPGAITGLTRNNASDNGLAFVWTLPNSGGAVAYVRLDYRLKGTSIWTGFPSQFTGNSGTITGLSAASLYEVRAVAMNSAGGGTPSATVEGTTSAASSYLADIRPFVPNDLDPVFFTSISEPASLRKQDGSQALNAADEVWTWQDLSGKGNHLFTAGNANAAGTSSTAGRLAGDSERVAGGTFRPIVPAGTAFRLLSPLVFDGDSGFTFIVGRIRSTQTAVGAALLGTSENNNRTVLTTSHTSQAGAVTVGATLSGQPSPKVVEVNTAARPFMASVTKPVYNGNEIARIGGAEVTVTGESPALKFSGTRVSVGNVYSHATAGSATAADFAWYAVVHLSYVPTRAQERMLEGWAKATFGTDVVLASGHAYDTIAPAFRSGVTTATTLTAANLNAAGYTGPWLGDAKEILNDSYYGGRPAIDDETQYEGTLYSLTKTALDEAVDSVFTGYNPTTGMYHGCRYPKPALGFTDRGFRVIPAHVEFTGYITNGKLTVTAITGGLTNPYTNGPFSIGYGQVIWSDTQVNGAPLLNQLKARMIRQTNANSAAYTGTGGVGTYEVGKGTGSGAHAFTTDSSFSLGSAASPVAFKTGWPTQICPRQRRPSLKNDAQGNPILDANGQPIAHGMTAAEVAKYAFRKLADVSLLPTERKNEGGGLQMQYHSPPPAFKTTRSYIQGTWSEQTGSSVPLTRTSPNFAARCIEIAESYVSDLEWYHQNIAPVKMVTGSKEASNESEDAYGTNHPVNNDTETEIMKRVVERVRASTILADLTAYGGGPGQNKIHFHGDSHNGPEHESYFYNLENSTDPFYQEVLSTGKTLYEEYSFASGHRLNFTTDRRVTSGARLDMTAPDSASSGGGHIRTNTSEWISAKMRLNGKSGINDENEDFWTDLPRTWRFTNRVLYQLNMMLFTTAANGQSFCSPLHWAKGSTYSTVEGYVLAVVNIATGTWTPKPEGWAHQRLFYDYLPWNSMIREIHETSPLNSAANQRAAVWDMPNGKRVVGLVNRQYNTYAPGADVLFARTPKILRGTRITLAGSTLETVTLTDLGTICSTSLPINLAPFSFEVWVEQDGVVTLPSANAPANTSLPTISGTVKEGFVLTGNDGAWTNSPTFARQWLRNGIAITSATGQTYTLVTADVGAAVTFRVSGTANGSTTSATSAPTVAVLAADDAVPNAFSFTPVTGAALNATVNSGPVTVAGINVAATVVVTGGAWSKNGGAYQTADDTVVAGDVVRVQVAASPSYETATSATLTIGGVAAVFSVTTQAAPVADTVPNAFAFPSATNVARGTQIVSSDVTPTAFDTATTLTISNGSEYSFDSGSTWASTSINNFAPGTPVRVRHLSNAAYSTATTTVLTIGGVAGTFTSTTLADPGAAPVSDDTATIQMLYPTNGY